MAKVKDYFSHDYHARSDLRGILKDYGLQGIGFYWCFVEILHENGGTIKEADLDSIAFELRADSEMCQAVVKNYDLFKVKGGKVTSDRVQRNLKKRAEISEARKSAAEARWNASEAPRNASGEASDDGAPFPQHTEEIAPCGSGGFLGADEKRSHAETVKWYKEWFAERLDQFEADAVKEDDFQDHPIWGVGSVFKNIVDEVSQYPTLKIAKKSVKTTEFLGTMRYFMWSRQHLEELADVIREVNEKADQGRIKNKQNYLIAAIYQAARVNGGSAN